MCLGKWFECDLLFVMLGEGAKDKPKPSHSEFPPTFPLGSLELNSFIR